MCRSSVVREVAVAISNPSLFFFERVCWLTQPETKVGAFGRYERGSWPYY